MGDAVKSVITTEKHVYRLNSPTNLVEMNKAFHWATQDYETIHGKKPAYDDIIQIEAEDDKILIWFVNKA